MQVPWKKKKRKNVSPLQNHFRNYLYLSRFLLPFLSKNCNWLQKRAFRLFSNSLHFVRKYGNVTDIRFLLLPRPVTSQHDFRHRFASRFTVRSHANRFLTSLRAPWINLNRSFTCSDSTPMFFEFHNCATKMDKYTFVVEKNKGKGRDVYIRFVWNFRSLSFEEDYRISEILIQDK